MKKQLLIMTPCRERHQKLLEERIGEMYEIHFTERTNPDMELLTQAEVIIGEPTMEQLAVSKNLRWLQMTWAGTDRYTKNPGFPEGVVLTNGSGIYGGIISEYIVGGILYLYRNFRFYNHNQESKIWKDFGMERMISGKRVLILGAGDIGRHTAKRLQAFDAVCIGIRRQKTEPGAYFEEMHTMDALYSELPKADIVVSCLPSTPKTDGLLDEAAFAAMKDGAVVVNVGRGSVIQTEALEAALKSGKISGAVLDVTSPEPLPKESTLWEMEQVLLTPHISGPTWNHSPEIEDLVYELCLDNLVRYAEGRELQNVVDFASGYRKSVL